MKFWRNRQSPHPDLPAAAPTISSDVLGEIAKSGHPFILLRNGSGDEQQFVSCRTQNEADSFANSLAALPWFSGSRLLRGIERALRHEIYDAADLFFLWSRGEGQASEMPYIATPDGVLVHDRYNYPIFLLGDQIVPTDQRADLLSATFEAYVRAEGNDALRFTLIEALALGLSRAFGAQAKYVAAHAIVERGLSINPHSIHLKAARQALRLKIDGKQVPPRLEKFIGADNGYLRQFVCPIPFERLDIGYNGDALLCCGHWLPTVVGNFMKEPIQAVLNSPAARKIRESVTDGSYKYCNHLECALMAQDCIPRLSDLRNEATRKAVAEGNFELDGVRDLMFAFDQTCNLSCPSCRTHVITEKASDSAEKTQAVEEKLVPLLSKIYTLQINPAGELFASKPSRKVLALIDDKRCPNLRLNIISNGTLFDEKEWNKFPGIHDKIKSIRISVDAASKTTFEKLRRLGKYEPFLDNMRFLRKLRTTGKIPRLMFSFTYQLENFREMPAFVKFCDEMCVDLVIFEQLQNIAFSHEEFVQKAVHDAGHLLHSEFIVTIKHPMFRSPKIWHDFDFDGVAMMTGDEARSRFSQI